MRSTFSTTESDFNLAQFGSLTLLLGVIGLRAPVLPRVIEALLLGDIVWLVIYVPYIQVCFFCFRLLVIQCAYKHHLVLLVVLFR